MFQDQNLAAVWSPPIDFVVTPIPDCENSTFGPTGRACVSPGVCVDATPFDGSFACNCSPAVFATSLGPNCEPLSLQQGATQVSSSGWLSGTLILAIALGGAALLALVGLLVACRHNRRSQSGHSFEAELAHVCQQGIIIDAVRLRVLCLMNSLSLF
jgi:hypothetical protein